MICWYGVPYYLMSFLLALVIFALVIFVERVTKGLRIYVLLLNAFNLIMKLYKYSFVILSVITIIKIIPFI